VAVVVNAVMKGKVGVRERRRIYWQAEDLSDFEVFCSMEEGVNVHKMTLM
jgi:hypothetical protein